MKGERVSEKLKKALYKRALGYDTTEVVEEYSGGEKDGEVVLLKKKVTKKPVPPDITALKILIDTDAEKSVAEMSDEELMEERNKLLKELKESPTGQDKGE